tara:strand:- start:1059 stop:1277 length:219 start_codon:yes stop_codon:yes gene_type:complete
MKTLRHKEAGNLKRRPDKESARMVLTGKWEYIPKSVWKKEVRDIKVAPQENTNAKEKVNKPSKAQKRQAKKH